MELSYILNELGESRDDYFRAIAPPIIQTSNFAFSTVAGLRAAFENEYGGWLYSRGLNPTVEILRKKLAALDQAEDCLVFNSGAAAIFAAVVSNVKAGDHIISVREPYTWARKLFDEILPKFKVSITYVDGTKIENFENALLSNTRLIYLESPNSWFFQLQDLAAIAKLARTHQIITVCDNSYCTPIYQQPITLGIDLALQSATKFIGGHSDTVAGVLCGSKQMMQKIFNLEYLAIGSGIQPFNAWLLIRGLRTLPLRLEKVANNTQQLFNYLQNHLRVENVIYPLDPSFPQYALAQKQMSGAAGLLTFHLKVSSLEAIELFCNSLQHILMAVSWGGHESLLLPKAAGLDPGKFDPMDSTHRSIRFYVGLEEPDYLIQDLNRAFEAISHLS